MSSHCTEVYIEIPVTVYFLHNPKERQTLTYPGCEESVEIEEIKGLSGKEWDKFVNEHIDEIEQACWNHINEKSEDPRY